MVNVQTFRNICETKKTRFIITRVSIDQWNNDIEIESNVSLETI